MPTSIENVRAYKNSRFVKKDANGKYIEYTIGRYEWDESVDDIVALINQSKSRDEFIIAHFGKVFKDFDPADVTFEFHKVEYDNWYSDCCCGECFSEQSVTSYSIGVTFKLYL